MTTTDAATLRLADILEDLVMETAEISAEAGEQYEKTVQRAAAMLARIQKVQRMAGLPPAEMPRIERRVRRAS